MESVYSVYLSSTFHRLLRLCLCSLSIITFPIACEDVYKNCATYKANGNCRNGKYEKWMKTYCAKTCGLCGEYCVYLFHKRAAIYKDFHSSGMVRQPAVKWSSCIIGFRKKKRLVRRI